MEPSKFDEIGSIRAMLKHIEEALLFADSIESRLKVNLPEIEVVDSSSSDSSDSNYSVDSKSSDSVVCLDDDKVNVVDLTELEKQAPEEIAISEASTTNEPAKSIRVRPLQQLIESNDTETASLPTLPEVHPIVCSLYYKAIICNLPASVEIKTIQSWAESNGFHNVVDILIHKKIPYPTAVLSFTSKELRDAFLVLDSSSFKDNTIKVKVFIDECCPEDDLLPKKSKNAKRKKSDKTESSNSTRAPTQEFVKKKRKMNQERSSGSDIFDC